MSEHGKEKHTKITAKQVVAWIGIILLILLYAVTFIMAFVDTSASGKLFILCLFSTVAVPCLIWVYTWMYGKLTGRHTIADPTPAPSGQPSGDNPADSE